MKQKYRKGVGIFLINKRNQLWVGKRSDYKNEYWQMPQGGIDGPESPENAMKRELMEETGLNKSYKIISKTSSWLEYKLPRELVNEVWNGKYIGQKQIWFACRFFGKDDQDYIEVSHARSSISGKLVRRPLEDQKPFLDRELITEEMIIDPIDL